VRALRLQHRIVIPFAIVALVATAAAALVSLNASSDALQTRVQTQLRNAVAVVSRGGLALNPAILRNLEQVIGAEIVTLDRDRGVVASTTTDDAAIIAVAHAASRSMTSGAAGAAPVQSFDCGGRPCLVAIGNIEGYPGYVVVLVAETSELTTATRAVARVILIAAAISGIVMVLVSQAVVRRVTAPLDRLVRFVRELAPTGERRRAEVGANEVGALAEAFNEMLDRVDQSNEALVRSEKLALAGLIAARVAHDIRNPLSSIKMQAQMLRARVQRDPDDQASVEAILHDIEQVESVIRDLLELARPGELRTERVSVNTVLQDALRHVLPQFRHRKILLDTRFDEALAPIPLDSARLKQALLNVLVNASEAMPTGGHISIATECDDSGEIRILICDDGLGIDEALGERVFDPFVSTKRDGVGLGLVTARAIIEAHGGRIRLARRRGRPGTCATIWLPGPSRSKDRSTAT
jgi:signal transduction histidine kinase